MYNLKNKVKMGICSHFFVNTTNHIYELSEKISLLYLKFNF